ncbi:MAG: gliding motility-associated protein GldE [Bacteroidales bacterium]|jgi:gliding motility-associated protein GldE|nr:gliding motility-associated protein GldE [Bacteroidales bacterium]
MDPDPEPYIQLIQIILSPFYTGFTVNALIGIIILCLLLVASALISSSETAFFSLKPADLEDLESRNDIKSQLVLKLREKPKTLLATILIGNNFVNVTITLLATYIVSEMFDMLNHPMAAFVMEVVVITSLVLIIGEITPKIVAAKRPVKLARFMARPLQVLIMLFKPLSRLLVRSTSFMDKHLEKKKAEISMDDLTAAVDIATESSTPLDEKNMLKGIATFTEKEVSNVMKPRIDIIAVEHDMSFQDMLVTVIKSGFSRIPVYEETLDKVSGILYVKDLLPYLDAESYEWQRLIRPAFFVPENRKINDLFQDFREKKIHIAIVVDEYGGTSGLITMEDVIEEIVGEINDEFDNVKQEQHYTKIDDSTYLFKAQTSIVDFCKVFNVSENYFEPMQGEADTLAGLVLEIEGRIPEVGFSFNIEKFHFEITEADTRHIIQIKVGVGN